MLCSREEKKPTGGGLCIIIGGALLPEVLADFDDPLASVDDVVAMVAIWHSLRCCVYSSLVCLLVASSS